MTRFNTVADKDVSAKDQPLFVSNIVGTCCNSMVEHGSTEGLQVEKRRRHSSVSLLLKV